MKAFVLGTVALFLISFSVSAKAQSNEIKAASGRFYCNATYQFDVRMDVDFFGNSASMDVSNNQTGQWGHHYGTFDKFRSSPMTSYYELENLASIEFPADYETLHWFQLTYHDSYGWIYFDCNHF